MWLSGGCSKLTLTSWLWSPQHLPSPLEAIFWIIKNIFQKLYVENFCRPQYWRENFKNRKKNFFCWKLYFFYLNELQYTWYIPEHAWKLCTFLKCEQTAQTKLQKELPIVNLLFGPKISTIVKKGKMNMLHKIRTTIILLNSWFVTVLFCGSIPYFSYKIIQNNKKFPKLSTSNNKNTYTMITPGDAICWWVVPSSGMKSTTKVEPKLWFCSISIWFRTFDIVKQFS